MVTPRQLQKSLSEILSLLPDARFEAGCILSHVTGKALPLALLEPSVPEHARERALFIAERRSRGEPLQYLLGEWEFYGMKMLVGEGVLIPRQDTECLVDTVTALCRGRGALRIADLCTGSGCIALALKKQLPEAAVMGLDRSEKALFYAEKNRALHGLDVDLYLGDAEEPVFSDLDVLVSNPPYLTAEDMEHLQREVTFEPAMALFGGEDGLSFYRLIARRWKGALRPGGLIAFEGGMGQAGDISRILEENGYTDINTVQDLNGIDRVVTARNIYV